MVHFISLCFGRRWEISSWLRLLTACVRCWFIKKFRHSWAGIILYEVVINLKAVASFPFFILFFLYFLACSLIALAIEMSLVYVRYKFHCLWEAEFGCWCGGNLCVPSSSCSLWRPPCCQAVCPGSSVRNVDSHFPVQTSTAQKVRVCDSNPNKIWGCSWFCCLPLCHKFLWECAASQTVYGLINNFNSRSGVSHFLLYYLPVHLLWIFRASLRPLLAVISPLLPPSLAFCHSTFP